MRELIIDKNEGSQRLDRFLRKYLDKAPYGFIQRMIRKKNIKVNGKRAQGDSIIREGDVVQLYLADETIDKFREGIEIEESNYRPNIIYEDENLVLVNKPTGILSHGAGTEANNVVDGLIYYLYKKGEYNPREEKTFVPAICNRLDRNTSGIIIGAKNATALRHLNSAIKSNQVGRYYKTIVQGKIDSKDLLKGYLIKDRDRNKAKVLDKQVEGSKKILTKINIINNTSNYSLLEVELITGRTHQIRAHLSSIGHPIIGDKKYGSERENKLFWERFKLENQLLHCCRIKFLNLKKPLDYLNNREFMASPDPIFQKIEESLFL